METYQEQIQDFDIEETALNLKAQIIIEAGQGRLDFCKYFCKFVADICSDVTLVPSQILNSYLVQGFYNNNELVLDALKAFATECAEDELTSLKQRAERSKQCAFDNQYGV